MACPNLMYLVCSIWQCARRPNSSHNKQTFTPLRRCRHKVHDCASIQSFQFLKVFGEYLFHSQTKLAVVVTEKALLGSVNTVLTLPLLYHLHRVEDDATNRVTIDYCEIVHKNISSLNCI